MKIELDLMDRLIINTILPKENNIMTLKIVKDLKNSIGITEEEHKEFELVQEGANFKWNKRANDPKSFEIGEVANDIIIKALKDLDGKKKLTEEMIGTYEKFVK